MNRAVALTLASLTAFLVLFPLTLDKPGLPPHLKADEAAYYLAAQSLVHDHDLRVEVKDVDRAFEEFPFGPINNMILMTDDDWKTAYYGKPFLYSLVAAPFAGLFGANGLLCLNLLLTLGMVWMGTLYLRRYNDDGIAALFSACFFLLSVGFSYAFWLQPEVFNMFGVAACLFFGLPLERSTPDGRREEVPESQRRMLVRAALSGAATVLPLFNKPMFSAVGVAPLLGYLRRRQWKALTAWIAAAALSAGLVAGLGTLLTGHPVAYLGVQRSGVTLCQPGVLTLPQPVVAPAPLTAVQGPIVKEAPTHRNWGWLIRKPDVTLSELAQNIGYFLWGRHTGFFLYTPFAALALFFFLLGSRRTLERWLLLATVSGIALFFLVFIAWNWQGGGGFVGNRYFVSGIPAFLFLVTEIRPRLLVPVGGALAGLFLGPLLFTPFGAVVPEPTLQSHVRNAPFRYFPLELSLRNVPGYERVPLGPLRIVGRKDLFLPRGDQMWLRGASETELYVLSEQPVERAALSLGNVAPRNHLEVRFGAARQTLDFDKGEEVRRLDLKPGRPDQVLRTRWATTYAYRLVVRAATGRIRPWVREFPPSSCPYYAQDDKVQENFYVGATLAYLGTGKELEADIYRVQWGQTVVPPSVEAGSTFTITTRLFNRSPSPWAAAGSAGVYLSYHWLDEKGATVVRDGVRTAVPLPLPPGSRLSAPQSVIAPPQPGRYILELDPVFEGVAWFSEKNGGQTFRVPVEVRPATSPPSPPASPPKADAR